MGNSQRDHFIDMVLDRFIFKKRSTLSPSFTFIPKMAVGLSKTWVGFYCEEVGKYDF